MPANDLDAFFDHDDGMTTTGEIIGAGIVMEGYLDAYIVDFNLDDSGPSDERYTFVCKILDDFAGTVGKSMTVGGTGKYRITKAEPDGTGLLILHLYCEV